MDDYFFPRTLMEHFLKTGILGGTFDPIHLGHLRTAEEVCQKLGLEKVYLIPSASPPHKTDALISSFEHRLAMVRMAVSASPLLEALDIEGKRSGFSYSIETLKELYNASEPPPELFFILGTDAFLEIETWKEYRILFDYAHFVIIQRAGHEVEKLDDFSKKIRRDIKKTKISNVSKTSSGTTIIMNSTFMEISATRIREMVSSGRSIRFLVPETVRKYIVRKGLYTNYAITR